MAEEWRPVRGFEGCYEVSNMGNLRSLDRIRRAGNGHRKYSGRQLKQRTFRNGYLGQHLSNGKGLKKNVLIHRIVVEAFIPNPCHLPEVNHIDENRANNRVENLEWVTRTQNVNHGGYQIRKAVAQGRAVEAVSSGIVVARFISEGIAAKMVGGSQSGISAAARGDIDGAYGFEWRFAMQNSSDL